MAIDPSRRVDADRDERSAVKPKCWGRRVYADKPAREWLNDVADSSDPSLSGCLRRINSLPSGDADPKAAALTELLSHGLTFEETVVWYWWARSGLSLMDIHFAANGISSGGDPDSRQESVRCIRDVLESAAGKHPGVDPNDVDDVPSGQSSQS